MWIIHILSYIHQISWKKTHHDIFYHSVEQRQIMTTNHQQKIWSARSAGWSFNRSPRKAMVAIGPPWPKKTYGLTCSLSYWYPFDSWFLIETCRVFPCPMLLPKSGVQGIETIVLKPVKPFETCGDFGISHGISWFHRCAHWTASARPREPALGGLRQRRWAHRADGRGEGDARHGLRAEPVPRTLEMGEVAGLKFP